MSRRKIAVVGAGISGLSCAWLLSKQHDVTLYESEERLGGHSNTVVVDEAGSSCPVDTGFIVYNPPNYPNLVALFEHLQVETAPTNMSFAVSLDRGAYEYSGSGLTGLFGQGSNLLNRQHWMMVADLWRFFRRARHFAGAPQDIGETLGDWLKREAFGDAFVERHILPMAAAIWSTPSRQVLSFPAASFFRFFANHELLKPTGRAPWRTVRNGSIEYVKRLSDDIAGRVRHALPVVEITRLPSAVRVRDAEGNVEMFDDVVLATHADQALRVLSDADELERGTLGAFSYSENVAVLHTDPGGMPQRRNLWSAWNYMTDEGRDGVELTYWMNRLQPLPSRTDYFVTLNPSWEIKSESERARFAYAHPMFNEEAMKMQGKLWDLQARRRTWFCGSYFGYGFHEDGLQSGLAVAEQLGGVRRPWEVAHESGRIRLKHAEPLPTIERVAA